MTHHRSALLLSALVPVFMGFPDDCNQDSVGPACLMGKDLMDDRSYPRIRFNTAFDEPVNDAGCGEMLQIDYTPVKGYTTKWPGYGLQRAPRLSN